MRTLKSLQFSMEGEDIGICIKFTGTKSFLTKLSYSIVKFLYKQGYSNYLHIFDGENYSLIFKSYDENCFYKTCWLFTDKRTTSVTRSLKKIIII